MVAASDREPPAEPRPVTIVALATEALSIPLREPFVIATGRIDTTRAVLVRATLQDAAGQRATGLGEAAALPPVTREDQPDLLAAIGRAGPGATGTTLSLLADATSLCEGAFPSSSVARAGVEAANLDAWARLEGVPLFRLLGGATAHPPALVTDTTLPISEASHMAAVARGHHAAGFSCFKVKVGRDWNADLGALRAVAAAIPEARFRLDANAGFSAADAGALLDAALGDGLTVECYEQPCAALGFRQRASHLPRRSMTTRPQRPLSRRQVERVLVLTQWDLTRPSVVGSVSLKVTAVVVLDARNPRQGGGKGLRPSEDAVPA